MSSTCPSVPVDEPPDAIVVVGLGADGWTGLGARVQSLVLDAEVVLGGRRHLDLLPPVDGQVRKAWPSPLRQGFESLLASYDGRRVVALASGDPLVSGIGSTLVDLLGADRVRIEPAVSSVALARARMGWPAESVAVVSLVGRDEHLLLPQLAPGRRVIVLSTDEQTPMAVADLLCHHGYGASRLTVLGDLGGEGESRRPTVRADTAPHPWTGTSRLNVVAVELQGPIIGSWAGGLPDTAFEHDGQLTKRDLRVSALARLAPQPGQLLWDVGAGAGSVGIEWMRAHRDCRAVAVEANADRAGRIGRNAASLGVPGLRVVAGSAPGALEELPSPDAVFVGGGATRAGVLQTCLDALVPGGRLVVHGVTLETVALLLAAYAEHGGELTRIAIEHAEPIGSFTGWTPARAVVQWHLVRESR